MSSVDPRVALAQARLQATELRVRAAHQDEHAASHERQRALPIYDGQSAICEDKAASIRSLADQSRARADLIEAVAEAAYYAATGQQPPAKGGAA